MFLVFRTGFIDLLQYKKYRLRLCQVNFIHNTLKLVDICAFHNAVIRIVFPKFHSSTNQPQFGDSKKKTLKKKGGKTLLIFEITDLFLHFNLSEMNNPSTLCEAKFNFLFFLMKEVCVFFFKIKLIIFTKKYFET